MFFELFFYNYLTSFFEFKILSNLSLLLKLQKNKKLSKYIYGKQK